MLVEPELSSIFITEIIAHMNHIFFSWWNTIFSFSSYFDFKEKSIIFKKISNFVVFMLIYADWVLQTHNASRCIDNTHHSQHFSVQLDCASFINASRLSACIQTLKNEWMIKGKYIVWIQFNDFSTRNTFSGL